MRRVDKQVVVDTFSDLYSRYACSVVVNQVGIDAGTVAKLRREAKEVGVVFKVVKNRLAKRALPEHLGQAKDFFTGPTGIFFSDDPVALSKLITDFSKKREERFFPIGGYLDGKLLEKSEIKVLASLPPINQLRAQLLGAIQGSAGRLLSTLQELSRRVVRVLHAHNQKN